MGYHNRVLFEATAHSSVRVEKCTPLDRIPRYERGGRSVGKFVWNGRLSVDVSPEIPRSRAGRRGASEARRVEKKRGMKDVEVRPRFAARARSGFERYRGHYLSGLSSLCIPLHSRRSPHSWSDLLFRSLKVSRPVPNVEFPARGGSSSFSSFV